MNYKYHFIGIGGVGMSGLAKYLIQQGHDVSGSDISESKYTNQLKEMGAKIFIGHSMFNVPPGSIVVINSAIKYDNPELIRAQDLKCKIFHRSDLLALLSRTDKKFIGFAGTHGKTTTSGMTSYLLTKAGYKPSYLVGGIIPELNTNAEYNEKGNYFIAEMDESDGTLVKYRPDILVINNLEADHLDYYKKGLDSIIETFQKLLSNLRSDAKILINNDNKGNLRLKGYNFITFGFDEAEYLAKNKIFANGYSTFDVYHKNKLLLENVKIMLPGEHNIYNVLAVIAACNEAGIDVKLIKPYLSTFTGMGRRFQKMATIKNVPIYDDYAHHPTEIKATLSAMKNFTTRNVVAVFQPHRYTRLQNLWAEFRNSLASADRVIVTDVYAASEAPIEGISSDIFASELPGAEYISGSIEDVAKKLLPTLNENDIVIGLGAGSITNLAKYLLKAGEE